MCKETLTKQAFDKASAAAGFGPCASYVWPEIEKCYTISDEIDLALLVDIFWRERRIFSKLQNLRLGIWSAAEDIEVHSLGYGFPETRGDTAHLARLWKRLDGVIAEAKRRQAARKERSAASEREEARSNTGR